MINWLTVICFYKSTQFGSILTVTFYGMCALNFHTPPLHQWWNSSVHEYQGMFFLSVHQCQSGKIQPTISNFILPWFFILPPLYDVPPPTMENWDIYNPSWFSICVHGWQVPVLYTYNICITLSVELGQFSTPLV